MQSSRNKKKVLKINQALASLSWKTPDFTKFMELMVEIGNDFHSDYTFDDKQINQLHQFDPQIALRIVETMTTFETAWAGNEVNRVQVDHIASFSPWHKRWFGIGAEQHEITPELKLSTSKFHSNQQFFLVQDNLYSQVNIQWLSARSHLPTPLEKNKIYIFSENNRTYVSWLENGKNKEKTLNHDQEAQVMHYDKSYSTKQLTLVEYSNRIVQAVGYTLPPVTYTSNPSLYGTGSYYVKSNQKLYFVEDGNAPTFESVGEDFINIEMSSPKMELVEGDLYDIMRMTKHAPISDESDQTANFDLRISTKKAVTEGLEVMQQYKTKLADKIIAADEKKRPEIKSPSGSLLDRKEDAANASENNPEYLPNLALKSLFAPCYFKIDDELKLESIDNTLKNKYLKYKEKATAWQAAEGTDLTSYKPNTAYYVFNNGKLYYVRDGENPVFELISEDTSGLNLREGLLDKNGLAEILKVTQYEYASEAEKADEAAFNAIKNYRTTGQKVLTGIGIASGILLALAFGFIEGGVGLFLMFSAMPFVPIIAACAIGLGWGVISSVMQFLSYSTEMPELMIGSFGKNFMGEAFSRYHDEKGIHELTIAQQLKMKLASFGCLLTALTVGALCYKPTLDLPLLLGVGKFAAVISAAMGPFGLPVLGVICAIGVSINMYLMLKEAYFGLIKDNKSLTQAVIDLVLKPFKEAAAKIDSCPNKSDARKTIEKGLSWFLILTFGFLPAVGGLIFAGVVGKQSVGNFSLEYFHATSQIADIIGTILGPIASVLSRLAFTLRSAQRFFSAAIEITFTEYERRINAAPVEKKSSAIFKIGYFILALLNGLEAAAFYLTSQAVANPVINVAGSIAAGQRELLGENSTYFSKKPNPLVKPDGTLQRTPKTFQMERVSLAKEALKAGMFGRSAPEKSVSTPLLDYAPSTPCPGKS